MTVVLGERRSKPESTTSRKSTVQTSRPGELNPQAPKSKKKVRLHRAWIILCMSDCVPGSVHVPNL